MIEVVIAWLTAHIGQLTGLFTAILLLVEKIKAIPWRPISRFFRWIGNMMNTDIYKEVSLLKDDLAKNMRRDEEMHSHVKQQLEDHHRKLALLKQDIDENEKDRIRQIIFHYGAIVREGRQMSVEEFRYVQDIYYKYTGPLNGNGKVSEEYKLISDYFNCL